MRPRRELRELYVAAATKTGAGPDEPPVADFDREWAVFNQNDLPQDAGRRLFDERFSESLEQRFSSAAMQSTMQEAALKGSRFRQGAPYWCACGRWSKTEAGSID